MSKESSSMTDDPEFALRYWPVRDAILALSAHYKRRPGAVDPAILVTVPEADRRAVVQLLDGFDVKVLATGSPHMIGLRVEAVVMVGDRAPQDVDDAASRRRTNGPLLLFP